LTFAYEPEACRGERQIRSTSLIAEQARDRKPARQAAPERAFERTAVLFPVDDVLQHQAGELGDQRP
jgi:hypothetical protein